MPAVKPAFKVSNTFSPEIYNEIRETIKNNANWGPGSDNTYHTIPGRWVDQSYLSPELELKIADRCRELFGEDDLKVAFTFIARYQPQGTVLPYLWEHMDQNACQYLMDFCVEMNELDDWGVIVDDELFSEEENSAIFFHGQQQTHTRPPYPTTNQNSYIVLLFMALIKPGHWADTPDFDDPSDLERKKYLDLIEKHRWDSEIRYYEHRGHSAYFNDLPPGNYECPNCMQCQVVDPNFVDNIEGYIKLK
jgi:hypothetical protein